MKKKADGRIDIRVNEDEKYWWMQFAKARNMKLSKFIRKSILFYMKHHPESDTRTLKQKKDEALKNLAEVEARLNKANEERASA